MSDPAVARSNTRDDLPRRRWTSLTAWWLAWTALTKVVWVRIALWRWSYAQVRTRLLKDRSRTGERTDRTTPSRSGNPRALAWAVGVAARRVPRASCLTQALALEALMVDAGFTPEIRIGVARQSDGGFEAHAWVEHEGRVMIGGIPNLERFSVLPSGVAPRSRL